MDLVAVGIELAAVADSLAAATAKLASTAICVVILADFQTPADAPAFLRSLRAGQLHTPGRIPRRRS